jgi:hypothetical protein
MAVKKPATKRKAPVKKAEEPELKTELCYFKLITGDEIIGHVDETMFYDDGLIVVVKPMRLMFYGEQIILSPWGLASQNPDIFTFPMYHVVSIYPVDEQMKILHTVAHDSYDLNKMYFDQRIFNSIQAHRRLQSRRSGLFDPTDEDLRDIENEEKKGKTITASSAVPESVRTRNDIIDSLVELAEKAGKGKNASRKN